VRLFAAHLPPRESSDNPPLIVFLHGLAADENDLIGLAHEVDPRLAAVSFRAPCQTGYGGYAWFGIEFLPDGGHILDEEQAESSLEILLEDLLELRAEASGSKLILAGFSQGAMMAASSLLAHPEAFDAVWLMSGRYLPFLERESTKPEGPILQSSSPPILQSRPVYVQHGLYDDLVPVGEGRELAEVLRAHGHEVQFSEYAMGHQVGYESIEDASAWIAKLL